MASVFIDIPGIGNVEAKNAATEATLLEILKAIQGVQKNTAGKGGQGKKGADKEDQKPKTAIEQLGIASRGAVKAIGGFAAALDSVASVLSGFANVGDSLENAAQQIPLFKGIFGAVAAASVKANDAFLSASRSGANFGDDLNAFARSASAAGMTLDKFGSFVNSNAEGLIGLGSTVGQGVDNFTKISKTIRATGSDLFALGFSTEDINKGIANFGGLLRIQGRQGTMTNDQLAAASKNYMKEIDLLSKATGEERGAIESKMKQMAQDAQFQSFMSNKDTDVQNSFNSLITRLGPTLGNFAKDFITTGTLTSEQTQKIGSMYGQQALDELQRLRNKAQANQKATAEDSDRTVGVMIREGKRVQNQFGQVLAQSSGAFDDVAKANMDSNRLQADAMKNGTAEQKKAAEEGKKFNEQVQQSQATLAKFSNEFTIALANSGMLEFMMKTFTTLATLVQTFVVPAFQVIATILPYVTAGIMAYIAALAIQNGAIIYSTAKTYAEAIAKTFLAAKTTLAAMGAALLALPFMKIIIPITALVVLFQGLYNSGWSFGTVLDAIGDNLKGFGLMYVDIWLAIAEKIATFFGGGDSIKAARAKIAEERKELADREKARDEKRAQARKERGTDKERDDTAKKSNAEDAKNLDEKKKLAAENIDYGSGPEALLKQFSAREGGTIEMGVKKQEFVKDKAAADTQYAAAKTTAEKKAALAKIEEAENKITAINKAQELAKKDLPVATAKPTVPADNTSNKKQSDAVKQAAEEQKNIGNKPAAPVTPKDKQEAAKKGDGAKQELESKGQAKAAADEKAAAEKAKADEKAKSDKEKDKAKPATQESAETLLASLNTKMTELIKISKGTHDVNERQLNVQKGLTSDLFAA